MALNLRQYNGENKSDWGSFFARGAGLGEGRLPHIFDTFPLFLLVFFEKG